jgi:hypothetical protein
VLFPRVEVTSTVKNDGFWASEFMSIDRFSAFSKTVQ